MNELAVNVDAYNLGSEMIVKLEDVSMCRSVDIGTFSFRSAGVL